MNYFVQVAVSNLWESPDKVRKLDEPSLSAPVEIEKWLTAMDKKGTDGRLGLLGRLESQLLYGEPVQVVEEKERWMRVCCLEQASPKDSRGYPGWIPTCQLTTHPEYDKAWSQGPYAYVWVPHTELTKKKTGEKVPLSYMTKLPWIKTEKDEVHVVTPDGMTGQISVDHVKVAHQLPIATPQERVEKAHKFLGLPYLWGGTSSHGYDCSGFMYRIFAAGGIRIPRDASVQAQYGENIPLDQIKPGDLLFFAYEKGQGRIHHVGMYIGDNSFIHSPRTGQPIKVNRLTDAPYEEELCVARRYHGDEVFDETK